MRRDLRKQKVIFEEKNSNNSNIRYRRKKELNKKSRKNRGKCVEKNVLRN